MTLTVLLDRQDVAEVAAQYPAALDGHVLAYDLGAHFDLCDRGIRHITPWELIEPGDLIAARRLDDEVQVFWRDNAHITFCGMDLLTMARHRHIACLTRMAWSAFVIHRALERLAPTEVICFDDHTGHGLEQPPGTDTMPLLQPMLRGIAEHMGISTSVLPRTGCSFIDQAAHTSRDHGEPVDPQAILGNQPFVLFAGSGIDLLRQLPLIRSIAETTELAAVQLYRSANPNTLRQLRTEGHHLWHESQITQPTHDRKESDPSRARKEAEANQSRARKEAEPNQSRARKEAEPNQSRDRKEAEPNQSRDRKEAEANETAQSTTIGADNQVPPPLRKARAAFDQARRQIDGTTRAVFANPHVDHHWDFIFGDYARRIAAHVAKWNAYFERHQPELIVANYPTPILEVGAHRNIPALILPHGIMTTGDTRWHESLPHVTLGAASPAHRRRMRQMGIPNERIALTGDPGMDETLRTIATTTITRAPSDKPHILLVTSAITAPAHQSDLPMIDWHRAAATFRDLSDLARRRTDWQFAIKPHPRYDQTELYERLHADLPPARRWHIAKHASLIELAATADVVVVVNNRSSAIVEASLLNRPVYLLCGDMPGIDLTPWSLHRWPRLTSTASLESELNNIFTQPEYREQRAAQSARAAEQFLGETPRIGEQRCRAVIQELTTNAPLRAVGASPRTTQPIPVSPPCRVSPGSRPVL